MHVRLSSYCFLSSLHCDDTFDALRNA
uniref:Uncharacterized protein n=1 Tax=Arundo donax TaxID=35708 RepID=A0A0A9TEC5_ARUDO